MKPLLLVSPILPRPLRDALRTWNLRMLWVTIASFGRRIYVDQPCGYREPPDYLPRAKVQPEFALTQEQIRFFHENSYLGPFRLIPEDEAAHVKQVVEQRLLVDSPIYGFKTTRDRHLDCPELMRLITHPAAVERVKQLMGEDMFVWRSNVFEKRAGAPEITWHQGTTFLLEQLYKPALEPPDLDTYFEIAIWMALDPATAESGCVQVVPGTHRQIGTIRLTGTKRFLETQFDGEYEIDPNRVVSLPCRPGEFFIFSERVIHGSEPNRSNHSRMSFVWRYVSPQVRVYRNERSHRVMSMKKVFPLDKWRGVLVSGQDGFGYNRLVRPEEVLDAVQG